MMTEETPPVSSLTPSARWVYSHIEENAPVTRAELIEEMDKYHWRTIDNALRALRDCGAVTRRVNHDDGREALYLPK